MAIHGYHRRPTNPPRIPHIEQLALHAAVIALALAVVLLTVAG